MTPVYLMKFSDFEDIQWVLVNQRTWDYVEQCSNWDRFSTTPAPTPPFWLVDEYIIDSMKHHGMCEPRQTVIDFLTVDSSHYSWDQTMVNIPPSVFGGEQFDPWEGSVAALMAFCQKHGLTIAQETEGTLF